MELWTKRLIVLLAAFLGFSASLSGADRSKYITTSEIKSGMKGYCLTCLKDSTVEKFDVDILGVVHNLEAGRDTILVQCTDERMARAGVIAGCSGSPVYIEGRLAGAMAMGWTFSKDALYGVTPIEDMLKTGEGADLKKTGAQKTAFSIFDFSKPIDFAEVDKQYREFADSMRKTSGQRMNIPCTVSISGFTNASAEELKDIFEPFGMMVTAGGGAAGSQDTGTNTADKKLEPGAPLVVPIVSGDMSMAVSGTVTEVLGNDVFGFGHSFLGYGQVDLPMATGEVHTVAASLMRSFKIASPLQIVGALRVDGPAAVRGVVGEKAKTFDIKVKVDRDNSQHPKEFKCTVASNKVLSPQVVGPIISNAVQYEGQMPPENMVEYNAVIKSRQGEPIIFSNISTGTGPSDIASETVSAVRLLMNNPFKAAEIESINVEAVVKEKDISARLWSAEVLDPKVKAGESIEIKTVVDSFLSPKKLYTQRIKIPTGLAGGEYELAVCGAAEYQSFVRSIAPQRFLVQNFEDLTEALNYLLKIERDRLYFVLVLPAKGIILEKAELSDLPATKALVLTDSHRSLGSLPYRGWVEESVKTGTIITGRRSFKITVEE